MFVFRNANPARLTTMRRPTAIVLVLMGGGLAVWGLGRGPSQACRDARAQGGADAEAVCSSSSSSSSRSGSSGYHSSSGSSSGTAMAAVSRGGFGGSGASAAGS
jgi:hypothetical protein